ADGPVDLVVSAAGMLAGQAELDRDPIRAGRLVETNLTGHVTTLLAVAARLRAQGHGTIVVLSSVAAVRPRRANYVYGAAKAGRRDEPVLGPDRQAPPQARADVTRGAVGPVLIPWPGASASIRPAAAGQSRPPMVTAASPASGSGRRPMTLAVCRAGSTAWM